MNHMAYDEQDRTILLASDFLSNITVHTAKEIKHKIKRNKCTPGNHGDGTNSVNDVTATSSGSVDVNCNDIDISFTEIDLNSNDVELLPNCVSNETLLVQNSMHSTVVKNHKRSRSERNRRNIHSEQFPDLYYTAHQSAAVDLSRPNTDEDNATVCLILNDHDNTQPTPVENQTQFICEPLRATETNVYTLLIPTSVQYKLPVLTMNLSFAGAGFLGIYHLGVAKALAMHGSRLLVNVQHYTGASAGILVASVLAIKGADIDSINKCTEFTFNLAKKANKKSLGVLTPRFSLLEPLEELLQDLCPENAAELASGRLHVSLTKVRSRKNISVSQFHSNKHLIQCLLASSYIPFVTGTKIFTIDGRKYVDGGLTDNLPLLPKGRTITVTPFCGKENICPIDTHRKGRYTAVGNMSVQLTPDNMWRLMHAFYPPNSHTMKAYHERGYNDTVRFLKAEGFYS